MKFSTLLVKPAMLAILATYTLNTQAQNFVWAKNFNNLATSDMGRCVRTDAAGNVYTAGVYIGSMDIISPGVGTITSQGADMFILKQGSNGNIIWGKSFGGATYDDAYGIVPDANGNVYVAGTFSSTVTFGTTTLTAFGNWDAFVLKLDANGNVVWVRQLGGTEKDEAYALDVDNSGNIYVTGLFSGTADLDPGSGVSNFTSHGYGDIYIEKLNPAGNLVWVKTMGGSMIDDAAYSLHIDNAGNVLTTGTYAGTVDFDPGPGVTNLALDGAFIQKLDANGNFIWVKAVSQSATGYGITTDASNNVLVTGIFWYNGNIVDFDPGPATFTMTSNGFNDNFVLKLNASGNFVWAKQIGSTETDWAYGIATDAVGNVYTTGFFDASADFDPGPGTYTMTAAPLDMYLQKLDPNGNFLWAKQWGTECADQGFSVTIDASNNILMTGFFQSAVDFDPGPAIYNLVPNGGQDPFILKLSQEEVKGIKNIAQLDAKLYPNPTADKCTLVLREKANSISISIVDAAGAIIEKIQAENTDRLEITLDDKYTPGNYFIHADTEDGIAVLKLQKL